MRRPDEDATLMAAKLAFVSPNEADSNGEPANVVDALFFIGRALHRIADALHENGALIAHVHPNYQEASIVNETQGKG